MHSPYTNYLKQVSESLKKLDIPVFFELPAPEVAEPFFLIGNHNDDDSGNPKYGNALVNVSLQIDLYYPATEDRATFEDVITQTKQALQPARSIQVSTTKDSTIGRTLNRAIFQINTLIQ